MEYVFICSPAGVDTPIFERCGMVPNAAIKDAFVSLFLVLLTIKRSQLKSMAPFYPIQRTGLSIDVATAVAFLANDDLSGWVTGQLLAIDGGYTLTNGFSAPVEQKLANN